VEEHGPEGNQVSYRQSHQYAFLSISILSAAFNWKQKKLLQEDNQAEEKLTPIFAFGSLENTPQMAKILNGMTGIDVTDGFNTADYHCSDDMPEFGLPIIEQSKKKKEKKIKNPKIKVQTAALFGSHKVGFLVEKQRNVRFQPKVTFGRGCGGVRV
jgi:hypothetical protein